MRIENVAFLSREITVKAHILLYTVEAEADMTRLLAFGSMLLIRGGIAYLS